MSPRPRRLIGVLGTHTEVGKTYVTARWLCALREQGFNVAARKPVQSFDVGDATTDAAQLAAATGESAAAVCAPQRNYPLALAPPMASDLLGQPHILLRELVSELRWQPDVALGVVETVGGPRSPLAHDGDSMDLINCLGVDQVLLVADASLGVINLVQLCAACVEPLPLVVFLNRFDVDNQLHRMNRAWLTQRAGLRVAVCDSELTQWLLPRS
jgi:dethiobiotin synthetase